MTSSTSRRGFFKQSSAVSAIALLGGLGQTACGGTNAPPLTETEQLGLSATQALAAMTLG